MAGLNPASRPSASSFSAQGFASKLLLLLAALPLTLAILAFILQWRGGLDDPASRWPSENDPFPGMGVPTDSSSSSVLTAHSSQFSDCTNILGEVSSPSLRSYSVWRFDADSDLRPRICITTSTSAGLEQILPWIFYHKVIGVTTFFLFVEGKAARPSTTAVLKSISGVKVIFRTKDLEEKQAKSRIWNETWLAGFFYKPCNYELFVKQSLNMEMAIIMAREAGVDWIIHLDTDELLYPAGARDYSLRQLLKEVPSNVDMVIFPNYESSIERDDIKDPFGEDNDLNKISLNIVMTDTNESLRTIQEFGASLVAVSMFKRNYDHLPKETYFGMYKEATRGNPNYFLTYGNGKSAARIQDHLRPNGAHRWHNYMKTPNEIKLDEAAVLHYTYAKFSDLTSRRDRCGCKPTKEDVKRCFMLDFDRSAFIIASTATEEEMLHWFREHVVWTDKQMNLKLLRKGILTRIYAPMSIMRGLRESGLFRSVIANSRKDSEEELVTTMENPINKTSSETLSLASRNAAGRAGVSESDAVVRKILEAVDSFAAAVPPLSPPALDDFHSVV